ncbi:MAG TPA: biotin--[acetyl-CoA-carboxylase] ligase [Negativicutes bacterium]|nr:biotin--[acetyl-CoA-carboxylase] ligase [Negativicutes bacterium]
MKNKILEQLKSSNGQPISGEEISKRLGISRTAVWKHIKTLRSEGYNIESQTKNGYRLTGSPDRLTINELEPLLQTGFVGRNVIYLETVDSTNTYAKRLAEGAFRDGTVVVAEEQDAGRGRLGRHWVSPAGKGIWMTLLLKPDILPTDAPKLTIVAVCSVARALHACCGLEAGIKWPNDIVANGRKLCGILTEMSAEEDEIKYVVVGIGINANLGSADFGPEVSAIATSVSMETGVEVPRKLIAAALLNEFEKAYTEFVKEGSIAFLLPEYRERSAVIGREVRIISRKGETTGEAVDINEEGQLLVRLQDGSIREIMSGEVSVRGIYGYI